MTQETREALVKVRALIARGWTQGHRQALVNGVNYYSLAEAIRTVRLDYPEADLSNLVRERIASLLGLDPWRRDTGLVRWNDKAGRTQEDVLRLLDSVLEEGT